ncbi:hypothetical protein INS49_010573 [Diaporthe citri]|uniref:uncharacterized protein n=1 Tax=Diaporthe citri TaxID=83186 RepID=UPI001C7EA653|nr:uncharacterized protein INS49_010573 [Diaporthe citri]KAG6362343.1 hypothetical protein INS49_010573 [Diaporthe citri]
MSQRPLADLNHNNIINFKIPNKQDRTKHEAQFTQMLDSMDKAEDNFGVLLAAATRMSSIFANFNQSTRFDTEGVNNLVQDLKKIFALLRLRLRRDYGFEARPGRRVATPGERLPDRIVQDAYQNLCPLTTLLQSVAQSISDLKVGVQSGSTHNGWGAIDPLRRVLNRMEENLYQVGGEYTGLAQCIMFHERNSRYIVTSTAPRYKHINGLQIYALGLWHNNILRMRNVLPPQSLERVEKLEDYSENLKKVWVKLPKEGRKWTGAAPPVVESIMGCNASFGNTGVYMTACLLDHLRFQMTRPEKADKSERNAGNRDVHGPFSCAEWELYITLLNDPDPDQPYAPRVVAMSYGMPKARTWETHKPAQRPPTTTNVPPRPSPLPAYPKPTAQRVGMGKSSTFGNHPQALRHEAAGQVITKRPTPPQKSHPQGYHTQAPRPAPAPYTQLPEKKKAKPRRCCF